ncbi:hypothetical protein DLM_1738 [Aquitalea magnusonii]|uniref:Four helix bundle protein n=1 Tax=Aquitalea magnusonii TaxID=332411 RepID=A0A3G9GD26_9NEIS|nr:hypothetical protein [Aquitalea magnusonii]BBF85355.1 hypothetical protein DLM_1738 [Aquitalea magnusonii]
MASKNTKANKPKPAQPSRLAEQKRFQRTEDACRRIMDLLFAMQRAERFAEGELAGKYAIMAGIHYRKIRHGKVMSAADFNAAVEVCTAARRCLQQLDASLQFDQLPDSAGLQQILPLIDGVLADYQQLKSGKPS